MLIAINYHYIRPKDAFTGRGIFGVTPEAFNEQLSLLKGYGTFISAVDIAEICQNPNHGKDELFFHVTFDDGLAEQYHHAVPILSSLDIPATYFINTSNFTQSTLSPVHKIHLLLQQVESEELLNVVKNDTSFKHYVNSTLVSKAIAHYHYDKHDTAVLKFILNFAVTLEQQEELIERFFQIFFSNDQSNQQLYMTTEQVSILMASNSIGSHGHTHQPMGLQNALAFETDLDLSQSWFARQSYIPLAISYPYGSRDVLPVDHLELLEAEFKIGFSMERAANIFPVSHHLFLSRFDCNDLPLGRTPIISTRDLTNRTLKTSEWFA